MLANPLVKVLANPPVFAGICVYHCTGAMMVVRLVTALPVVEFD